MATAVLSSKGQITIPPSIRAALHIDTGSRIEFIEMETGKFAIIAASNSVKALKRMFSAPQKPVTLEDSERAFENQGVERKISKNSERQNSDG